MSPIALYYTFLVSEVSTVLTQLGIICNFFTICFFASPLSTMVSPSSVSFSSLLTPFSFLELLLPSLFPSLLSPPHPPSPTPHSFPGSSDTLQVYRHHVFPTFPHVGHLHCILDHVRCPHGGYLHTGGLLAGRVDIMSSSHILLPTPLLHTHTHTHTVPKHYWVIVNARTALTVCRLPTEEEHCLSGNTHGLNIYIMTPQSNAHTLFATSC